MRFFYNVLSGELVTGLGEATPVSTAQARRRDGDILELQLFTGVQGDATPIALDPANDVRWAAKEVGKWGQKPILLSSSFTYDETNTLYTAKPSLNTLKLLQLFITATALKEEDAGRDLVATDINALVAVTCATSQTVTVSAALEAAAVVGTKLWLCCISDNIAKVLTVAGASGITVTAHEDLDLVSNQMLSGEYLQLRKTAANAWLLEAADEKDEIQLMAEFSWRELAEPDNWRTTPRYTLTVVNDIIRGDEGAPRSLDAATLFITRAEIEGGYLNSTVTEGRYHRNDSAQSYSSARQQHARNNAGLNLNLQTLSDAATIAWDMSLGLNAVVTVTNDRILGNPTNVPFIGASGYFVFVQNATGGRVLGGGSSWNFDDEFFNPNPLPDSRTVYRWYYDGTKFRLSNAPAAANQLSDLVGLCSSSQLWGIRESLRSPFAKTRTTIALASSSGTADLVPLGPFEVLSTADMVAFGALVAGKLIVRFEMAGRTTNTTTASNLQTWVRVSNNSGAKSCLMTQALGTTAVPAPGREFRVVGFLVLRAYSGGNIDLGLQFEQRWHTTDTLANNWEDITVPVGADGLRLEFGCNVSAASSAVIGLRAFATVQAGQW